MDVHCSLMYDSESVRVTLRLQQLHKYFQGLPNNPEMQTAQKFRTKTNDEII